MITSPALIAELDRLMDLEHDALENPYPLYARMRSEALVVEHRGVLHVSSHRLVEDAIADGPVLEPAARRRQPRRPPGGHLTDPEDRRKLHEVAGFMSGWLVSLDPPDHSRVRGLIHRAFTPRRARAESQRIRLWSYELAMFSGTNYGNFPQAYDALQEFRAYLARHIEGRSANPSTDVLSALLEPDSNGDRLRQYELEATFMVLLFGGHETTTNLVGTASMRCSATLTSWTCCRGSVRCSRPRSTKPSAGTRRSRTSTGPRPKRSNSKAWRSPRERPSGRPSARSWRGSRS
jgi:cytochrome P450